jgi:hypothetical protein
MDIGSLFCGGGNGQVAKAVKAHGGLYALLKSIWVWPLASGLGISIKRPAPYVVFPEVASAKVMKY